MASPSRERLGKPPSGSEAPTTYDEFRFISPLSELEKLFSIRSSLPSDQIYTIFLEGQGPLRRLRPAELHAALKLHFPRPELLLDVRYSRSGLLIIKTRDHQAAEAALHIPDIAGIPVRGRLAPDCAQTAYLLRGVDPSITVQEIYEILSDSHLPILEIRRFTRRDGDNIEPSSTVYFSVASASPLESVTIYYQRYHCERYIPRPRQCRRCLNFGHSSTTCRGRRKCITCGADHDPVTCTAAAAGCVRCGGEHSADSPRCPAYQQEARLLKFSAIQRCSYLEAKRSQSNSPKSYATVVSTSPPKPSERTPRCEKQPALSTIGQTGDILILTNRISQLESVVEKLCAELSLLRSIIQPNPLNPTQESLREPSLNKDLTASTSNKRSSHPVGPLTPAQLPKKKKGSKPRPTDPLAASDSEGQNSDMDHTYSTGSTSVTPLEDSCFASPAEKAKLRRHPPNTPKQNV
ncbi:uncharacterized protein LOC111636076 [Centruroides sculpturatus]|uniref:uncharacterized protein LOC111636076 n=1 Tax=Centruroides sculpturatus TaxID=218467 RepID=UPI000C6DF4CB|nr:uncharacterized protein LOC111636076 [Centruroides sculpturatus]